MGRNTRAAQQLVPHNPLEPPVGIGHVLDVLFFRCGAPPWMIIGAAGFESMIAIWSIFSPNWKDAIKEGPQHRSWLHQGHEAIDDGIVEAPKWYKKGVQYAFEFAEFSDFLAYWVMVGESVGEALLSFTSLVWELSECNIPSKLFYYHSKTPEGYVPVFLQWYAGLSWQNGYTNFPSHELGSLITIPAGATANIGIAGSWGPFVGAGTRAMDMRLVDLTASVVLSEHIWDPEHTDPKKSFILYAKNFTAFFEDHIIEVQCRCPVNYDDLGCSCIEGRISIEYEIFPDQ